MFYVVLNPIIKNNNFSNNFYLTRDIFSMHLREVK